MTLIEEMKIDIEQHPLDRNPAVMARAINEIDRLRVALLEAEAGLIMAGADVEPSGDFVPSPTAALRIVRTALVPNAPSSPAAQQSGATNG